MYSVTKRIDFCYGHRLLDYDGICKHPHGHNAVAEIEVDGCTRTMGIEYERSAKAASRYDAVREALNRDKATDAVLYLTSSDDILYLLAMELRATRKRIGFALSEAFRRSLLETRTLTNTASSEIVPLRELFDLRVS